MAAFFGLLQHSATSAQYVKHTQMYRYNRQLTEENKMNM